jgi:hypothetical protein
VKNNEEVAANDKSKNRKILKGNFKRSDHQIKILDLKKNIFKAQAKKTGQIMVQIIGEKKKTELIPLKDAKSNENDDSDENNSEEELYSAIDSDLGKIKNVLVKYDDKKENENQVEFKNIEIIDPRGNSYK